MKLQLIYIGKTNERFITEGMQMYIQRMKRYCQFSEILIPDVKNSSRLSVEQLKEKEAIALEKCIPAGSLVVLLDENGKLYNSRGFAGFIEKNALHGNSNISFVIGGAYGFSPGILNRGWLKISLSKMTFSHQIVRLFFMEQIYRAFTIIKNEPYHND
ncbi:MAG: 23S rRNA (pseudouridine(1915)-N(3))-methyltransferase RlmH [Marinilabiliales bacterium]|nr:MAG: 23S rRNA (pseudouridine(1915)-N(3))-methyltransferase RlmH [Marinilabiliales bacterium]